MEIKQLEYFVAASECGSFNKAAQCLYTSQPNVSKVVSGLEKELGRELFERKSKGIQLTPYGETIREYARSVLKNVSIINSMASADLKKRLSVSTYPSNSLAKLISEFSVENTGDFIIDHVEGTVEAITDNVKRGISEIGLVYVAEKQQTAFRHILTHKKLEFHPLCRMELCVYVGRKNPLYDRESVDFSELSTLKFISGSRDYFSMEHHLESVSMGVISTEELNNVVYSNSDFLTLNMLLSTDICSLGIDYSDKPYRQYGIKALAINGCEPFLTLGYVVGENHEMGDCSKAFLEKIQSVITK